MTTEQILKEKIIETINAVRFGSMDKKQFCATLDFNLDMLLASQRQQILDAVEKMKRVEANCSVAKKQGCCNACYANNIIIDDVLTTIKSL